MSSYSISTNDQRLPSFAELLEAPVIFVWLGLGLILDFIGIRV